MTLGLNFDSGFLVISVVVAVIALVGFFADLEDDVAWSLRAGWPPMMAMALVVFVLTILLAYWNVPAPPPVPHLSTPSLRWWK